MHSVKNLNKNQIVKQYISVWGQEGLNFTKGTTEFGSDESELPEK
jgi:hypothetical protein